MKKFLILFFSVLLTLILAVPVSAASSVSASLSVSDKTVNAGDKVTVTVSATVDSCGSGGIELSYDSKVFDLSSGQWLLSKAFMTDFDKGSKDGVFAFDSASKVSGKVFKFVLTVKKNAPTGKSNVTVKFKADSKTVTKTAAITVSCDHTYDNKCDTSCNKCGATRKITHSWDAGEVLKEANCTTSGSAKYKCKVCGETKTETISKTAHLYDHNCDTDCDSCGATREITHTFKWNCDATSHWQGCSVCGEKQESSSHTLSADKTGNATGHGYACTVCLLIPNAEKHDFDSACDGDCADCGYVRPVTHVYSERYAFDESGHWFACLLCGDIMEKFPHAPGDTVTETEDQMCTQCGYVIEKSANHIHTMAGDWLSDDTGHWYQCRCGEMTEPEQHIWNDGTVKADGKITLYQCEACGHIKAELYEPENTAPIVEEEQAEQPPKEPSGEFDVVLILLIATSVSLVLNIVLLIALIVISRRRNRYEG